MKICVLGEGLLAEEFRRMDFDVLDEHFLDFKIEHVLNHDIIVNTFDYGSTVNQIRELGNVMKCNVEIPLLLSEYCRKKAKRYVHLSTGLLNINAGCPCSESSTVCSKTPYTASKLIGESCCNKDQLVIRVINLFNDMPTNKNILTKILSNNRPCKNEESYSYTVDVVRGIVALLKAKESGIFNIACSGVISEEKICKMGKIDDIIGISDDNFCSHVTLDTSKLEEFYKPSDVSKTFNKCIKVFMEDIKGS